MVITYIDVLIGGAIIFKIFIIKKLSILNSEIRKNDIYYFIISILFPSNS